MSCGSWFDISLSSQIDYFERAKRLEEIPLIKKAYEEQRVKDMELWELQEEERVCSEKLNHCAQYKSKLESIVINDYIDLYT